MKTDRREGARVRDADSSGPKAWALGCLLLRELAAHRVYEAANAGIHFEARPVELWGLLKIFEPPVKASLIHWP